MGTNKSIDDFVSGQEQRVRATKGLFEHSSPSEVHQLLIEFSQPNGVGRELVEELQRGNAVYTTSFADVGERPSAIGHQVVNVTEAIQPEAEYHRGPTYQLPER